MNARARSDLTAHCVRVIAVALFPASRRVFYAPMFSGGLGLAITFTKRFAAVFSWHQWIAPWLREGPQRSANEERSPGSHAPATV